MRNVTEYTQQGRGNKSTRKPRAKALTDEQIAALERFRLDGQLTYGQMAAALSVHYSTLLRVLRGCRVDFRTAWKLQKFLESIRAT